MKQVVGRIHHSTHPPFKLILCPNTKVSDVLSYLNLPKEDYIIYPVSDPARTLYLEENLCDVIESDAKLIAKLSPAARSMPTPFYREEKLL
jgi:hypothetical protein